MLSEYIDGNIFEQKTGFMKRISFLPLLFIPLLSFAQIYTDYLGAGHNEGVIVSSSSQEADDDLTINGAGHGKDLAGASRFMTHAALGASLDDLIYVDSIGFEAWIDEQLAMPATSYEGTLESIDALFYDYYVTLGLDPELYEVTAEQFRYSWSHIAQTAPDLLRHRIALALSEILVISSDSDLFQRGYGLASYYDVLSTNAFGNYKDLLYDVTLHPTMGFYLSHYNNPRANPTNNTQPDENYAREIMQLFTIGLYELNPDGSRKMDVDGAYIPTYDNDDIKELAKVFTGLGMGDWEEDIPNDPFFGAPFFLTDATEPMSMYQFFHEPEEKLILGEHIIPAGQAGLDDIEMAIDILFNHPNVAPFISNLLIKRLVKSNPTPAYVERVAMVFEDNGNGERGDLAAVVKAILLDEEARACSWIDHPSNGKLKEPVQRYTQFIRGLRAETSSEWFWNRGFAFEYLTDQFPMHSPTVFNFFLPDYQPNSEIADANLTAPEFQIFNSSTSAGYFNWVYYMTLLDYYNEVPEVLDADPLNVLEEHQAYLVIPDLEDINTDPDAIVDYLDMVLAQGNMSQETRDVIAASCEPLGDFPEFLLKMAFYLTLISPDFAVMK